jgi:NADP-dependent 3-hydroxy acid dehydrogenase YdfG
LTCQVHEQERKSLISFYQIEIMKKKVWFVTGASKGLGLALVKELLKQGYRVAATSRNREELEKAVNAGHDTFLPLIVDLNNELSVERGIKATVDYFGAVDVIVNNAGYGLAGALEELSDAEARQNFDVNVFGSLNVIRKVLPYLRKQRSGHISIFLPLAALQAYSRVLGSIALPSLLCRALQNHYLLKWRPSASKQQLYHRVISGPISWRALR